ncbi:MAG: FecR domain-containing protein [Culturomica sp.]|nr:FecR domain-containing protein [Culturomica sp.]
MEQRSKFFRIVELMLAGTKAELSEQEALELDGLLDTPELQEIYNNMNDGREIFRRLEQLERYDGPCCQAAFADFKKQAKQGKRRRIRLFLRAGAAAITLLLTVIAGQQLLRPSLSPESQIGPATEHALLYTYTGTGIPINGPVKESVYNYIGQDTSCTPEQDTAVQNQLVVPRGATYTIRLADGTKVVLNADSELRFPALFSQNERRVTLKGEAYFDVAKDPKRPFIIHTGDSLDIRVLGTKFNVQTYGDIPKTAVTLIEGSVSVSVGLGEVGVVLKPAEQAVFDRKSTLLSVRALENTLHSTAWSNGYFDFEATHIRLIIKELEKWYNVEIDTGDIDLDELGLFSLHMSRRTTIAPILNMLHEITGLNFRTTGRTVYLFY